jgi:hypothetical protein
MYILIYFLGIIGFLVILNNPIIFFLLALISIFLTLFLVQSRIFFFYLITLLIALKPITIDLFFWNKYIFGFKATHIFSVSLIILAFFLIFKLKVKITKFNLWILPTIYFLYHFFITLFSIQYGIIFGSLDYFLRNCAGVPFFFLIGHLLENEKDFNKFLKIILIPLIILIVFSTIFTFYRIDEFYMITGNQKQFWRLKLLYHDSTQLVIYLTMAFIILCYLFIKENKIYYLALIYLTTIPIYATQTRSAWTSSSIVFLFFSIYKKKLYYLIPIILFIILNLDSIIQRWDYAGIEFDEESGFSGRVGLWKFGILYFINSDLINKIFGVVFVPMDFHNQYVHWLVSNGIFGLLFNLFIFLTLIIRAFLLNKNLIIIMAFLWIFISNFSANFLTMPNVNIFLWSILGYELKKRENLSTS